MLHEYFTRQSSLIKRVSRRLKKQSWLRRTIAVGMLLMVVMLFGMTQVIAGSEQPVTLRCRLEQTTITTGAETTFILEVLDVSNLYGYELNLKYNGTRIHFEDGDATKNGINFTIGDFLKPDFVVTNNADNSTGVAQLVLTQLSPSEAVNGSGELARAVVTGVGAGIANFTLSGVVLSDPAGNAIPVVLQNCNLEVTGNGTTPPSGDAVWEVGSDAQSTLIYTDTAGLVTTIVIPAGAVTDTITLVYNERPKPITAPPNLLYAGVSFSLNAYRNNVELIGYVFIKPIQFSLEYADADVIGLREASAQLFFLNRTSGEWSIDSISVIDRDVVNNGLVVSVIHLSEFATFAPVSSSTDNGAISGEIYEDLNKNTIRDPDELGVWALIKLYLLNSERQWVILTTSDGLYGFNYLPDGLYFLEITPLISAAFVYTTLPPSVIQISIENGSSTSGLDFGLALGKSWVLYLPRIDVLFSNRPEIRLIYIPFGVRDSGVLNE